MQSIRGDFIMNKRHIYSIIVFFIIYSINTFSNPNKPDLITIKSWLRNSINYTKIIDIQSIHLKNKENAFLSILENKDTNDQPLILIRPALKKAQIIFPDVNTIKVMDLDHDGVSEIEVESGKQFQNLSIGNKSIIQINDWQTLTLQQATLETNEDQPNNSKSNTYSIHQWFEYIDLDGDKKLDLVKYSIISVNNKHERFLHKYLFKNGTFYSIQTSDSIKIKNKTTPPIDKTDQPDLPTIKKWLDPKSPANYKIIQIQPVHLMNKEKAYLAILEENNFRWRLLTLIRPQLKMAKIIEKGELESLNIMDLDNDGISEIQISGGGTYQGYTVSHTELVHFHDWDKKILLTATYEDNSGVDTKGIIYSISEQLKFGDIDGDKKLDLIKKYTYQINDKTFHFTKSFLYKKGMLIYHDPFQFSDHKGNFTSAYLKLNKNNEKIMVISQNNKIIHTLKKSFSDKTQFSYLNVIRKKSFILIQWIVQDKTWYVNYYWDYSKNNLYFKAKNIDTNKIINSNNLNTQNEITKYISEDEFI